MTTYRLYFRDQAGSPAGWAPIRSTNDAGARKLALAMLRERSEIRGIDAWRDSDLAFRLNRFDVSPEGG